MTDWYVVLGCDDSCLFTSCIFVNNTTCPGAAPACPGSLKSVMGGGEKGYGDLMGGEGAWW